MRRAIRASLLLILFWAGAPGLALSVAPLVETPPIALSVAPLVETPPIALECARAILVEPDSGQVILEKNASERCAVASVNKIMSILLACEACESGRVSPDDVVLVGKNASGMGGSQVLLDTGEAQPFRVLLKSMIVSSANDATLAVAEHLYGSEALFVARMNERAKELGMADTLFANSTGLPGGEQYTTARDVAVMAIELTRHPLFFEFSTIWMDELDHGDGRVTEMTNTNRLIRLYEGCDGVKTGSTAEAGYCVAATAKRGDMRVLAVVLGADTGKRRFSVAGQLLDYAFANYRVYRAAERGAAVRGELPVVGGEEDAVKLVLGADFSLLIEKGAEQRVTLAPSLADCLRAPFAEGTEAGSVDVLLDGRVVRRVPVLTGAGVARQGYKKGLGRVLDRWFYR